MRQLWIDVPAGKRDHVFSIAEELGAKGAASGKDLIAVYVPNEQVDRILHKLEEVGDVQVAFAPATTLLLHSPLTHLGEHIRTITDVSPFEVYVRALQSTGSWKGLVTYATVAGAVVWMALLINSSFLLVAGMLISPFSGPAMNAAIGTATGEWKLLRASLERYVTGLLLAVLSSALLSFLLGLDAATPLMIQASNRSAVAVLAPLAAGITGAVHLFMSDRNSLVPTAAVGAAVAATLAPPAAVIGMAIALGRWDLMQDSVFALIMQLFAINAAGAVIFWIHGLRPARAAWYEGNRRISMASAAGTALALAALLVWQFSSQPGLQRASRSQQAIPVVERAIEESGLAHSIQIRSEFTRPRAPDADTLLVQVYVYRRKGVTVPDEDIRRDLAARVRAVLRGSGFEAAPYVAVHVLQPAD